MLPDITPAQKEKLLKKLTKGAIKPEQLQYSTLIVSYAGMEKEHVLAYQRFKDEHRYITDDEDKLCDFER